MAKKLCFPEKGTLEIDLPNFPWFSSKSVPDQYDFSNSTIPICPKIRTIRGIAVYVTRKCPPRGHCLAPPEGPGTRVTPGVNLGGRPRGSGGDSKAI